VPGAAQVAFDSAAQASGDKTVTDAETALFNAVTASTDTKVQAAYAAYTKAVEPGARSAARWNLEVAIDGSTDKALGTAIDALDAAVKVTADTKVKDANAAVIKAVQDSAASVKSTGDKLTAAQAALAAAQKALADAQK